MEDGSSNKFTMIWGWFLQTIPYTIIMEVDPEDPKDDPVVFYLILVTVTVIS